MIGIIHIAAICRAKASVRNRPCRQERAFHRKPPLGNGAGVCAGPGSWPAGARAGSGGRRSSIAQRQRHQLLPPQNEAESRRTRGNPARPPGPDGNSGSDWEAQPAQHLPRHPAAAPATRGPGLATASCPFVPGGPFRLSSPAGPRPTRSPPAAGPCSGSSRILPAAGGGPIQRSSSRQRLPTLPTLQRSSAICRIALARIAIRQCKVLPRRGTLSHTGLYI